MIQPVLVTNQPHLAPHFAQLRQGERKVFDIEYFWQGIGYHSKTAFWRGIDGGHALVCPTCGCNVRVLSHYESRPGLACVACVSLHKYKADELPERKPRATNFHTPTRAKKPVAHKSKAPAKRKPRKKAA